MLATIKNKIFNYIFIRFENHQQSKKQNEKELLLSQFKKVGFNFKIGNDYSIKNPQYIEIGENFSAENRLKIDAIESYGNDKFKPEIIIGKNVVFINDIHIGAISKIIIGDGCLLASKVYISDHSHGEINKESLNRIPIDRPLVSKGDVVIGKNVWIGEGAAILPNVIIGDNCIIGANAVVTKSIPSNCIVAGVPAKVIKDLN